MAFFALIHGGAHGGWCWERLTPELERLGHGWSAPDLPFDDPAGASEWADAVIASIPPGATDVIVVGHSLGGLAVPVVASRMAVHRMVFLGAMVPIPGVPLVEVWAQEPDVLAVAGVTEAVSGEAAGGAALGEGDAVLSWEFARGAFYQDLPEDVARSAWQRLRPQGMAVFAEPCPIDAWPAVPATYILMTEDQSVNPAWSRRIARGRLNADVIELPGGHSPFYGRPEELAATLDRIAAG
ncbi:MAG TPA: alpha/beta fold hydrolase [Mycobacteriales bacterium]|nr:alpha/beta fold hydrolase [Mycobacteriales bacterium]